MTSEKTVTVYTKLNCPNCELTKQALQILGIEFRTQLLTSEDIQRFKALGLRAAPVVEGRGMLWGGYDRAKIAALNDR